jgi:hypothetical protein
MLDYKITYGGKGHTSLAVGYVDSDFAGDIHTQCSCSGHIFMQAGGPIAWSCQYQPTVALSTTEAKYMAMACAARQILWTYSAMSKVSFPQPKPACLIGNNTGAITLMKNIKHNICVKHIYIHHHLICKCIEMGDISVEYTPSADNLADLLTTPLGWVAHHCLCIMLRLCNE